MQYSEMVYLLMPYFNKAFLTMGSDLRISFASTIENELLHSSSNAKPTILVFPFCASVTNISKLPQHSTKKTMTYPNELA